MTLFSAQSARAILFFAAVLVWPHSPAVGAQSARTELKQEWHAFLEGEGVSGGVLIIDAPGHVLEVEVGTADQSTGQAVTLDTRFYLASVGKPMVAAALLSAHEQGLIQLADAAKDHLQHLPEASQLDGFKNVTVRQLLNHTSGLAEYLDDDFMSQSLAKPKHRWTSRQALTFATPYSKAFPAGTDFAYNNTNYVLLGEMLAGLDGSLPASLSKRVFGPSKMQSASVGADPKSSNLARGYDQNRDVSHIGWNSVLGDGAVVASARDLHLFARGLFRGGLFGSASLWEMEGTPPGPADNHGLGIAMDKDETGRYLGHDGSYFGFEAEFRFYPEEDLLLIYAINGNQETDFDALSYFADWYLAN
ncbi:MAG: serine hydrolase domain-containing protein [Pseudomonadota bacterium]